MKSTIFYLEGRGGCWIFHFFIYNLGGLFYILDKKYDIRNTDSVLLKDKSKIVNEPTTEITFPIKIYMEDVLPFQREAFEIIKDKFELIEDLNSVQNYEIVSIYGETCKNNHVNDNPQIYHFLRNLFIEKMHYPMIKGKRIFITRLSNSNHNGRQLRIVLNENALINMLNKYNFEYVQLEKYTTFDKIKLFMESEIILSTHGSQLTFSLFSNTESKIIEILNKGTLGFPNNHIVHICNSLKLNYNRYSDINEDESGNCYIDVKEFEKYLLTLL